MERYFIFVYGEFDSQTKLGAVQKEVQLLKEYQALVPSVLSAPNAANLPVNHLSLEWAICIAKTNKVFKGSGSEEFQRLNHLIDNLPSEEWDSKSFNHLNNCAVDIILHWNECPDFWKSFNPSINVKIIRPKQEQISNQKLFWRGTLKMKDPQNPSHFGHLENAELSYNLDQLDLLTSQIRGVTELPVPTQRKTFCPFLELISAFNIHTVPFIFYTSTQLILSVKEAEPFWKSLDENVAFLFRLDYATDEVEHWEKEMSAQSIYFLSHWAAEGELRLIMLKGSDQIQSLANVFVRLHSTTAFPSRWAAESVSIAPARHLRLDKMEKEIRRLQLLAIQSWIEENGSIHPSTMDALLDEVALAVSKDKQRFMVEPEVSDCLDFSDADLLKWKLEKKTMGEVDRPSGILQPNGRTVTVDVAHILRCLGKKASIRSPRKVRADIGGSASTRLKPNCDLETARTAQWPDSSQLKYHGINYNLKEEDERGEKLRSEYQDKWVPLDTASASWCNPWSINISTTYQLSTKSSRQPVAQAAGSRTPKKSQQPVRDLAQLRKSPRLLAKTSRPTRSPKKNLAPSAMPKDTFKQQLKAVIIKVLGDQKITTKDPLFRTCANKLSVICMALLKDSKTEVTPRQMYQVAKSQAKQVLQFVKP